MPYGHTLDLSYEKSKKTVIHGAGPCFLPGLRGSAGGMGLGAPARSELAKPRSDFRWDPVLVQKGEQTLTGGDRR